MTGVRPLAAVNSGGAVLLRVLRLAAAKCSGVLPSLSVVLMFRYQRPR
jgi:hypothetical protein